MPARRRNLTYLALAALAVAVLVAGCGGSTWKREFSERMEASSGAVEKALPNLQSDSSETEWLTVGGQLGRQLLFKDELIGELEPPAGCEKVQQKGKSDVYGLGRLSATLLQNMTPYLLKRLPETFEEGIEKLGVLKREAARCESG